MKPEFNHIRRWQHSYFKILKQW